MKAWMGICVLAGFLIVPGVTDVSFCQQQEDAPRTQSKQGVVTQIDSIGSFLVVSDGSEEFKFSVDPEAKIKRGIDDITLDDLESNDNVTVEYYKSPDGVLKAATITDSNIISSF